MGDAFPDDRKQNREALLDDVDKIAPVLQACGANSEELGTLSAETVIASPTMGMVKLRLCTEMGGSEAEPVTEMMVLEQFAYLERRFTDGNVRSAAISFFPRRTCSKRPKWLSRERSAAIFWRYSPRDVAAGRNARTRTHA